MNDTLQKNLQSITLHRCSDGILYQASTINHIALEMLDTTLGNDNILLHFVEHVFKPSDNNMFCYVL